MRKTIAGFMTFLMILAVSGSGVSPSLLSEDYTAEAQNVPVLYWGTSGENVRTLQRRLRQWGYYQGAMDGVYGAGTYQAVVDFQRKNGVWPVDGVVGRNTWAALGLLHTVTSSPGGTSTAPAQQTTSNQGQAGAHVNRSDQLDLLARVVAAEAEGEPFEGQVAVAAVILNRVKNPGFPNTLSGVIYQPHAFESVTNGLVWRRTPSAEAVEAARAALNGWDPTYGSIFFWNPSKPVVSWIWSRPIVVRIGNHVFAH